MTVSRTQPGLRSGSTSCRVVWLKAWFELGEGLCIILFNFGYLSRKWNHDNCLRIHIVVFASCFFLFGSAISLQPVYSKCVRVEVIYRDSGESTQYFDISRHMDPLLLICGFARTSQRRIHKQTSSKDAVLPQIWRHYRVPESPLPASVPHAMSLNSCGSSIWACSGTWGFEIEFFADVGRPFLRRLQRLFSLFCWRLAEIYSADFWKMSTDWVLTIKTSFSQKSLSQKRPAVQSGS